MRKSILRASAGLQALALLGAGTAASFIVASPAAAQDYTSGAIMTTVTSASGAPVAGAAVTLRSIAQGQVRNFVTDANGTFNASGLTPGEYAIHVTASGYQPYDDTLTVTAAQESRVTVSLTSVTQTSAIVVTGRRLRQTSTGGTTGLNVDVAAVNANAPIAHSITAVTLLAPTAERGVTGFGDVPSVGGSSVAENAYYINGLNITNPDTYVGSARVPFYFYKNVDVQTGGYAAEFGRATGGVINATTKSGTNDPFIAMHVDWQPMGLESFSPNIGLATGPTSIGRMSKTESKQVTFEGGGAIIPDHLFVYGLIEPQRNTYESASGSNGARSTFTRQTNNDPFWGGKVDAYINPTQHAEFTIFDTRSTATQTAYLFAPNSSFTGGTIGAAQGTETIKTGGLNWVARYTGDITNWITLSGAYGVSKDSDDVLPSNPNAFYAVDCRSGSCSARVSADQPYLSQQVDDTRRRFYRADADVRVSAFGQHHFRFGFDNEDLSENKVLQINGSVPIEYLYYGGAHPGVRVIYEHMGGNISGTDTAYYAQDSWTTPLDGLTLNVGIRDDIFKQYDLSGNRFANYKNNWGPRAAFTYTPPSMEKWKFFGSYGRYFIPPAMNLGFRGKDNYWSEYFDYPAGQTADTFTYDPTTGLPTAPLGPAQSDAYRQGSGYTSACPTDISSAPGNPINGAATCGIYGGNVQNPAIAKVAPGTKATYEDEFILGTRFQQSHLLSFGLSGTYRKLSRVSEDTDFGAQLADYFCGTAHYDATRCDFYNNNSAYYIWNVGKSSQVVNDWVSATQGVANPVTLTGLKFPVPKRTYESIVFDFNRADDGKWLASGSITWSKLKGNTEGTVKSDAGNGAQSDAGATQDFDYLGLSDYSYGLLPNDHRWAFKLFGAYHFNRFFSLGANIFVQSPMHGSCLSFHPTDPNAALYGATSFFCGSNLVNGVYQTEKPSPRGTGWTSQWMKEIDLSARINIPYGDTDQDKIVLRADVFNVLNSHAIIQRYAQAETSPGVPDTRYLSPLYYQSPRYVRLGLDVEFGGHHVSPPAPVVAPPPPPPPAAPATQTCPDGTVILATDACPAPPPPPPPPPANNGERGQ